MRLPWCDKTAFDLIEHRRTVNLATEREPCGHPKQSIRGGSACSRIGKSAKDPYKGYPLVEEEWPDGIEGIYGAT